MQRTTGPEVAHSTTEESHTTRVLVGLPLVLGLALILGFAGIVAAPGASAHGDDATMALVSSNGTGRNAVITVSLTYDNDDEPVTAATVTVTGDDGAGAKLDPVPMTAGPTPGQFTATVELPSAGTWNLRATSVTPSATITFTHEVAADTGVTPTSSPTDSGADDPESTGATTSAPSVDRPDDGSPVISPAPAEEKSSSPLPWVLGGVAVVICVGLGVLFVRRGRDQGPIE